MLFRSREFQRSRDAKNFADSNPDVIFCVIDQYLGNASDLGKDTINEINKERTFINKLQVFFITQTIQKDYIQQVNPNQQGIFARIRNRFKSALSGNSSTRVNEEALHLLQYEGLLHGSRIYRVYGKNHIFNSDARQAQDTAQVIYREIEAKIRRGWLLGLFDNQQP